jgi:CheY-like chemotaxis protein
MLGHELRNPLAPITTALELIELRGDSDRERGIIRRQVEHLTRMVDDLLDVSRIKTGKVHITKKKTRLGEVVARAIEMVSPLIEERGHRIELDVQHDLFVEVDSTRMSQVIANILTNAAKYTEPRGLIRIAARADGPAVQTDITDTGRGIEPDMLKSIFDLFTQEQQSYERSRGGLGLGLAIARVLVGLHGGTLTAHSDGRGKGSRFSIRLARVDESQPALPQQPPAPVDQPPQKRVLVVDDNRDAADMLAALAEHRGHMTRNAGDGVDALRILQEFTPDVALLDLGLPVMDGYELAQRIRQIPHLSSIRLVAVTGYGQPSDRAKARAAGFDLHLVKPVQLADVLRAIEE